MKLDLNKLNPKQREAVLHGDGPLLILAGAGSGKTSTMAYRIAHLISERRVPASQILGLSFTRKASQELRERVKKLVSRVSGKDSARGLTVTTFHSLCARILRSDADKMGFRTDFTILDANDQVDLLRQILRDIKVDDRKFDPSAILFEIGQAKNRFLGPQEAESFFLGSGRLPADYGIVTASAFGKYQTQLRALNAMDFDDLLFHTVELLRSDNEVRQKLNQRLRNILVDEYQDTNPSQFRLLRLLTELRQNICVVGDDDQSIYAWRGADPAHILEFSRHFPAAHVITLDQNYRSTSTILDAANEVIARNRHRHPKSLWSDRGTGEPITQILAEEDRAEAEIVAEEILKRARQNVEGIPKQIRPWKDFAVLYRSNPQSRLFEEALRMRGIPYRIVGTLSFLDRKEVKDVLSYWRVIVHPKDDPSARRILNWPSRRIGRATLDAISTCAIQTGVSFVEAAEKVTGLAPKARAATLAFRDLIQDLSEKLDSAQSLVAWGKYSLEKIGVRRALLEESDDPAQAEKKWENAEELINALGAIRHIDAGDLLEPGEGGTPLTPRIQLREFLAKMTLESLDPTDEDPRQTDQVTLLTLHGAKGLEYPVVFLVGMEEGFLPHRRTIEEGTDLSEERRLCYVGITRAKDHLILTRAKNRIRYGKQVPRNPSRFLEEIPPALIVTRDESHSPDLSSPEARDRHETKVKDFLAQIRAQIGGA